jgi:hypothetical protein
MSRLTAASPPNLLEADALTQVEHVTRLIELGYFDFFGFGTDTRAAEDALDAATRIDTERIEIPEQEAGTA